MFEKLSWYRIYVSSLPFISQGHSIPTPIAISNFHVWAVWYESFVHWEDLSHADASWENFEHLATQYPNFVLQDKDILEGESTVMNSHSFGPNFSGKVSRDYLWEAQERI